MEPGAWQQVTMGELGSLRNGVNFSRDQEGPGLPVLKVKDFGELVTCPLHGLDELDSSTISLQSDLFLQDDDVVIIRSNGNPALVGRSVHVRNVRMPTTFSGFCIRFRTDPSKADSRFIAYHLRSPECRARMSRFGFGTGIQNLNQGILSGLPIDLPPLAEQRAIASVLGALDDKIESNRRTSRALERLARAIFRAWFVDFEPVKAKAAGATTFPGMPQEVFDALPTRFVESELGLVPEGWGVKALEDFFEVNPSRRLGKGGVAPYLEMSDMPTQGHAPDSWSERIAGSGARFKNGDTLVARITPCLENGKTGFVDFLQDEQVGWGSTEYIVLRPLPPFPLIYAYLLARSEEFRAHAIQSMSGTSGRQRVPHAAVQQYLLVVPSPETLGAFGFIAEPMFELSRAGYAENRRLAAMRDYLLPKLLSGQVSLSGTGDHAP